MIHSMKFYWFLSAAGNQNKNSKPKGEVNCTRGYDSKVSIGLYNDEYYRLRFITVYILGGDGLCVVF
jgi:hypothetical protein